jgi:hypothetical protein
MLLHFVALKIVLRDGGRLPDFFRLRVCIAESAAVPSSLPNPYSVACILVAARWWWGKDLRSVYSHGMCAVEYLRERKSQTIS